MENHDINSLQINIEESKSFKALKEKQEELCEIISFEEITEEKIEQLRALADKYSMILIQKEQIDRELAAAPFVREYKKAFYLTCSFKPENLDEALNKYFKLLYLEKLILKSIEEEDSLFFEFIRDRLEFLDEKPDIYPVFNSKSEYITYAKPYDTLEQVAQTFNQSPIYVVDEPGYYASDISHLLPSCVARNIFDEILFNYYEGIGFPTTVDENNKKTLYMPSIRINSYVPVDENIISYFHSFDIKSSLFDSLVEARRKASSEKCYKQKREYIYFEDNAEYYLGIYNHDIQAYMEANKEDIARREDEVLDSITNEQYTTINFSPYDVKNLQRFYEKNNTK